MEKSYYPRQVEQKIETAMQDTPVILITGPRQAGKTTLVRKIAGNRVPYHTLDDQNTLFAAVEDPVGFIRDLDAGVIDEIQKAPALLPEIKKRVDEDRSPGRFLLTGSANLMLLPSVADSLAGRMEIINLFPFSQREIYGISENWLDSLFSGRILKPRSILTGKELQWAVLQGGYPEVVSRPGFERKASWFRHYLSAMLQRDIRDISDIAKSDKMPRLIRMLAAVSGQVCNYSSLGAGIGLDHKTVSRYVDILEQMYLVRRIEVYASNRLNRMIKMPKIQFIDSGILASLLEMNPERLAADRTLFGPLLETFSFSEVLKLANASEKDYQLLYYRDHDKVEVDLIIENSMGDIVGVEVKASATVRKSDLKGLKRVAALTGSRFQLGLLLYDGSEILPLGDSYYAVPVSSLWGQK